MWSSDRPRRRSCSAPDQGVGVAGRICATGRRPTETPVSSRIKTTRTGPAMLPVPDWGLFVWVLTRSRGVPPLSGPGTRQGDRIGAVSRLWERRRRRPDAVPAVGGGDGWPFHHRPRRCRVGRRWVTRRGRGLEQDEVAVFLPSQMNCRDRQVEAVAGFWKPRVFWLGENLILAPRGRRGGGRQGARRWFFSMRRAGNSRPPPWEIRGSSAFVAPPHLVQGYRGPDARAQIEGFPPPVPIQVGKDDRIVGAGVGPACCGRWR